MVLTERDIAVMRAMDRMRHINLAVMHKPLTKAEFCLLAFVCRNRDSGVSVSQAAEEMDVPMPAVSRLLRTMEEAGWVERTINREDRRSITIRALPEGEKIFEQTAERTRAFMQEVMGHMSDSDFSTMMARWNVMMDTMERVARRYEEEENE